MRRPIYAVADIHGQKAMLDSALARIEADGGADARVIFLGDLVDRGPDSRGVIDTLIAGCAAGRDWIVLRGNHDQMFLDFLEAAEAGAPYPETMAGWLGGNLGGAETMASYGVAATPRFPAWQAAHAAVPEAHRAFLRSLPLCHRAGGLLFVHAGIDPQKPLDAQTPQDMLWIREPFLTWRGGLPVLVVHGHTPVERPRHFGHRVALDGGAGFGRPLMPAVFEDDAGWLLTESGREPLTPPPAPR